MKETSKLLLHDDAYPLSKSRPIVPPLVQSANFAFDSVQDFRKAFEAPQEYHIYTRGVNPTVRLLCDKIAALEKAEDALAFASGSAAIAAAVMSCVEQGDHIIVVNKPYAWSAYLIGQYLKRFGIEHTFVDASSITEIEEAIQDNTRLLYLESPNSLTFELQDLKACADLAQENQITTIVDNSYCTPLLQNPIELGIDLVVHSGSKYLCGHSDVLVGFVCGSQAKIKAIFDGEYMTLGACLSPNDAWLVLRGLRTLTLRLEESSRNASKVVDFLKQQKEVDQVLYPWDSNFPQHELAKQQMRGACGLFAAFFRTDSMEKMEKFCNALTAAFQLAISWGAYESLQSPACVFYGDNPEKHPALPYTYVRFYTGLEDSSLLIDTIRKALPLLH